ncbi:MAG: RNase H-like domain-containing protein, partial [Lactococcus garvieae]
MQRLQQFGVNINPSKCVFASTSIEFLGHLITPSGISPLTDKVAAIKDFPVPTSKKQLRRFIGMINFYRRHIPHCATLLAPLSDLLSGTSKNVTLTPEAISAFESAKAALCNFTNISFLDTNPNTPLFLVTDASDVAVGGALNQCVDNNLQPLAFFSCKLQSAQTRYSTFGRELLAIYLAIKHFRHLLEGRSFTVLTDHKPLVYAFLARPDRHSPREIRQLDFIAQFTTDIQFIKGNQNTVADALSRLGFDHVSSTLPSLPDIAQRQIDEPIIFPKRCSLHLEDVPIPGSSFTIKCDISSNLQRPIVPLSMRRSIFSHFHGLSHPGKRASVKLISSRFVWTNMNKDIRSWTQQCLSFQRSRIHKHTFSA